MLAYLGTRCVPLRGLDPDLAGSEGGGEGRKDGRRWDGGVAVGSFVGMVGEA